MTRPPYDPPEVPVRPDDTMKQLPIPPNLAKGWLRWRQGLCPDCGEVLDGHKGGEPCHRREK